MLKTNNNCNNGPWLLRNKDCYEFLFAPEIDNSEVFIITYGYGYHIHYYDTKPNTKQIFYS